MLGECLSFIQKQQPLKKPTREVGVVNNTRIRLTKSNLDLLDACVEKRGASSEGMRSGKVTSEYGGGPEGTKPSSLEEKRPLVSHLRVKDEKPMASDVQHESG